MKTQRGAGGTAPLLSAADAHEQDGLKQKAFTKCVNTFSLCNSSPVENLEIHYTPYFSISHFVFDCFNLVFI